MPKQVRLSPDGRVAVIPCMKSDTVVLLDSRDHRLLASIRSPARMPVECAFSADSARAYVQCLDPGILLEIDLARLSLTRTSAAHGRWPKIVEFTPDRKELWVSSWLDRSVAVIDAATLVCRRTIRVARTPRGIGFLKSSPRAFVANFAEYHPEQATITEIDTATYRVRKTFGSLRGAPRHVVVSPDDRYVYVSNMFRDLVHVIDTRLDTIVANIPVGPRPKTIDLTSDGRWLYVADFDADTSLGRVSVVDTARRAVVATLPGGKGTTGLDVSPDDQMVWITNITDSTVWIYRRLPPETGPAAPGR